MDSKLVASLVSSLITVLLKLLPKEKIRGVVDAFLDKVEESIKQSKTPIDDAVVIPLIALIRGTFEIPYDGE